MSYAELSKIRFAKQYGSDNHKAKADAKIDNIIKSGDTKTVHDIASSSDLGLTHSHIEGILDHKPTAGFVHPAKHLPQWNSANLSDQHWDRLAKHTDNQVVMAALPSAPLKHVRTIATTEHHDPFIRQLAAQTYRNKKAAGYPE